MRICILFLSSILYCLNVFSASKSVVQKTVRMGDVVYIDQHGSLIQVDMKRVTVKPKTGALDKNIEPLLSNKLGYFTLQVPDGVLVEDYVNELTRTGDYETVEYIGMGTFDFAPNDALAGNQWHLNKINMNDAWAITTGDSNVKVAIIDTGVDFSHPDLGYGYDSYSNVDVGLGWDYTNSVAYSSPVHPHGTFVAGFVGAKTNNSIGIAGISGGNYSKGVSIISYCVANSSPFSTVYIPSAIVAAVDAGAKVINKT